MAHRKEKERTVSTTPPVVPLNAKTRVPVLFFSIPTSMGTFAEGLCSFIYILLPTTSTACVRTRMSIHTHIQKRTHTPCSL